MKVNVTGRILLPKMTSSIHRKTPSHKHESLGMVEDPARIHQLCKVVNTKSILVNAVPVFSKPIIEVLGVEAALDAQLDSVIDFFDWQLVGLLDQSAMEVSEPELETCNGFIFDLNHVLIGLHESACKHALKVLRALDQDLLGDFKVRQFSNNAEGDIAGDICDFLCLDELESEVSILHNLDGGRLLFVVQSIKSFEVREGIATYLGLRHDT
jgi:hypothetical protein